MFRLLLFTANPRVVKKWLIFSGVATGVSGASSIVVLSERLEQLFPAEMVEKRFIYMAIAIAFITGLVLYIFPKVISVFLAQLGCATSLIYLTYSLFGIFSPNYQPIVTLLVLVIVSILLVIFSEGVSFVRQEESRSDLGLVMALLVVFFAIWLYPLRYIWR